MKTIFNFNYFLLLALLLLMDFRVQGQSYVSQYKPGETLFYEVAYNWGILWVDAGEVFFRADTTTIDDLPAYYFDSQGKSYPFYDLLFKVNDRFQSVAYKQTLQPVWFKRDTYEGGYEVNNSYNFLNDQGRIISRISHSDHPLTIDTLEFSSQTFDVLTAIYYARTFTFNTLEIGERIPIRFIIDGEFYELYIRYLGKENKKNRDGKKYRCVKFSALLVEGTIFKGGEDLTVWVTDDVNKVPIMVEAKILIGSIKAYLTGYENIVQDLPLVE